MPGIAGFIDRTKKVCEESLDLMMHSMNHGGNCRIDRHADEKNGLYAGRVSLGRFSAIDQPVHDQESQCWILFHGEIYDNPGPHADPFYVLSRYLEVGDRCASGLNGIFHFAIFDGRCAMLKLFNDNMGLQPLYYSLFDSGMAFGGEIKALIEDGRISRKADFGGIADFFCHGQILGVKTLFQDVSLLQPGSVLSFDLVRGKSEIRQYWSVDDLFSRKGSYNLDLAIDDVTDILADAIKARGKDKEVLGLSLSGGLDSRGILAGLEGDAEALFTTTLGVPGCADERLAGKIAQIAKTRHKFIPLTHGYLNNYDRMTREMIWLSDGMYHPVESTEMLALQSFRDAPFSVLLRGHGGEIAKAAQAYPVMIDDRILACSSGEEILKLIQSATNSMIRYVDLGKLFSKKMEEAIKESSGRSLNASCGNVCNELNPEDVCLYYYLKEFVRREVVDSLNIFRSEVEVRLPYLDERFLKALLQLPVRHRMDGEIHLNLIKRYRSDLVKVPNANTGAPLDAGRNRVFVSDKFNSLMKKLGVKGYRHYTEFQKWYRDSFSKSVCTIIASERLRERNMYNPDNLMELFELHMSGKKNYGNLMALVVGLELWFRRFVD